MAACLAAAVAGPGAARGHAIVMESQPAPRETVVGPRRLVLRFNSRIEKRFSAATLVGPDQRSAALAREPGESPPDTLAYALPALAPGAYRVRWKVLAVDGHVTEGVLRFTVARP